MLMFIAGWFDHSRDLLHLVNHFRSEMIRPFVGMGHSMGGAQIANLAILHPSLFETIVLIDPVVQNFAKVMPEPRMVPAHLSAIRRDRWPSRAAAAAAFKKSKFYQKWDPRVMDLWIKWGLRDLPTKTYPVPKENSDGEKEVTLTTTKAQEVFAFARSSSLSTYGGNESNLSPEERDELESVVFADSTPLWKSAGFYRFEPSFMFSTIPSMRPKVLWIFGENSPVTVPDMRKQILESTGIGLGGSGGVKAGKVKLVEIPKGQHLIAMENTGEVASISAEWMSDALEKYRHTTELWKKYWDGVGEREKFTLEGNRMKMFDDKDTWGDVRKGKPKL
jgi:pimeloyl-ACP methyl ester carboxylesterase